MATLNPFVTLRMCGNSGTYCMSKRWNCLVTSFLLCAFSASASDWLQYRGNNHDAVSFDRITTDWTGSVTNPVWLVLVTNSFSSFTVDGSRAYTQINPRIGAYDNFEHDNFTNREACVALSITNGAQLWMTMVEENTPHTQDTGVGSKNGPRSTPVVYGDSVFVLTSYLKLYRLNAANGVIMWQKDLLSLYRGVLLHNEAAASPVIENGLVFVSTCADAPSYGAAGVSNLMAFSTIDGSLVCR